MASDTDAATFIVYKMLCLLSFRALASAEELNASILVAEAKILAPETVGSQWIIDGLI